MGPHGSCTPQPFQKPRDRQGLKPTYGNVITYSDICLLPVQWQLRPDLPALTSIKGQGSRVCLGGAEVKQATTSGALVLELGRDSDAQLMGAV